MLTVVTNVEDALAGSADGGSLIDEIVRDGARLNLRCVDRPTVDGERRDRESLLSAAVTVATAAEIKQLFLEFQAAGVAFHQTLKHEPWGARDFIIKDPDGNLLLFAGPAE